MFRFPWGDMHSLNLGWFLQKFNELRADWATAEENITGALDAEIQRAEDALSDVFDARDAAAASATAAAGSATAAGTSATAAQNSATGAASSATLANNKATAAGLSEAAAAQSAQQAGNSATAAAGSATAAGQSATNAAASETAAGQSATAAAGSETNAAASAEAASASETNAAASAAAAAASAAGISKIQSPLIPDDFYGNDFVIVKNGVTITKKGNRINFKGTQTGDINIRPFSTDYESAQYVIPPVFNMLSGSDAAFTPSHIVLETSLINNLETANTANAYVYSMLYTQANDEESRVIIEYLRANSQITQDMKAYMILKAVITEEMKTSGISYGVFINSRGEIDLDIIFKLMLSNNTYLQ